MTIPFSPFSGDGVENTVVVTVVVVTETVVTGIGMVTGTVTGTVTVPIDWDDDESLRVTSTVTVSVWEMLDMTVTVSVMLKGTSTVTVFVLLAGIGTLTVFVMLVGTCTVTVFVSFDGTCTVTVSMACRASTPARQNDCSLGRSVQGRDTDGFCAVSVDRPKLQSQTAKHDGVETPYPSLKVGHGELELFLNPGTCPRPIIVKPPSAVLDGIRVVRVLWNHIPSLDRLSPTRHVECGEGQSQSGASQHHRC